MFRQMVECLIRNSELAWYGTSDLLMFHRVAVMGHLHKLHDAGIMMGTADLKNIVQKPDGTFVSFGFRRARGNHDCNWKGDRFPKGRVAEESLPSCGQLYAIGENMFFWRYEPWVGQSMGKNKLLTEILRKRKPVVVQPPSESGDSDQEDGEDGSVKRTEE